MHHAFVCPSLTPFDYVCCFHLHVMMIIAVKLFFFFPFIVCFYCSSKEPSLSTLRHCALSHQTVSGAAQGWQPKHCLCIPSLSPRWEPWLVQVADRRLSLIVMSEVEYVLVKRLITQHLRPFFASSLILQPIMSKTLTNQMWAGSSVPWQQLLWWWLVWQEERVLLFARLSWLAGVCNPSLVCCCSFKEGGEQMSCLDYW